MDVQCERCKTEYEFDDALVSGRGTTVRCTHCGHQFKVRRSNAGDSSTDRWVVRTGTGHHLTFLTLRELQRAILAKQVARHDMLILGEAPPRPLGAISELEPFFDGRASSRPPPAAPDSVAYHAPVVPPPPARRTQSLHVPDDPLFAPAKPSPPPPPRFREPPEPAFTHFEEAPARAGGGYQAPPAHARLPPPTYPPPAVSAPAAAEEKVPSVFPPPTDPVRRTAIDDDFQPTQDPFGPSSDDAYDIPGRRRVGGWVVAFVLLLAVGVVGWVVAKPYLVTRNASAGAQLDARASAFLVEGEKAMANGDLETSQQDIDKASALAGHDPRVLLDQARVAAARADIPWLKQRLLPADAVDEARSTRSQLDEGVARARKSADEAVAATPDDPAAARAEIDALRLSGDRDAARKYVPKVSSLAYQPETAYVLAALDLTEATPFWATVIDRLRLAAAGEGNAGRARAALVYALATSGDAPAARMELAKLDALTRAYPCAPNLHALVDPAPPKAMAERTAAAGVPRLDAAAIPQPSPPVSAPMAGAATGSGDAVPGGQSSAMQAALQAIKRADFSRALRIYEALASRNPNDSEALAGIGDVERAQGDGAAAVAAYRRALAVNPSYLPALLGVADTEWANGDRASAQRAYQDVVDRFPDGTYPSRVKVRAEPPTQATPAPSEDPAKPYDPGNGI
jgi:predicted Zn finger-like uncharacterized protein